MQATLSKLRTWAFDHKTDDIRGWAIHDVQGRPLGRVAEVVVDTNQKHVTEIVLADGRRLPAHEIGIGDHVLTVLPSEALGETSAPRGAPDRAGLADRASEAISGGSGARAKDALGAGAEASGREASSRNPASRNPASRNPATRNPATLESDFDDVVVSLVEEEVEFGKRRFEKGNVQVQARVFERPFEHPLRLRDERVSVERRKVNEPLSTAEAEARLREQSVEVSAITEYPITEKHSRLVEEVVFTKTVQERPERLSASVRRTGVEVTEVSANATEPKESKTS